MTAVAPPSGLQAHKLRWKLYFTISPVLCTENADDYSDILLWPLRPQHISEIRTLTMRQDFIHLLILFTKFTWCHLYGLKSSLSSSQSISIHRCVAAKDESQSTSTQRKLLLFFKPWPRPSQWTTIRSAALWNNSFVTNPTGKPSNALKSYFVELSEEYLEFKINSVQSDKMRPRWHHAC